MAVKKIKTENELIKEEKIKTEKAVTAKKAETKPKTTRKRAVAKTDTSAKEKADKEPAEKKTKKTAKTTGKAKTTKKTESKAAKATVKKSTAAKTKKEEVAKKAISDDPYTKLVEGMKKAIACQEVDQAEFDQEVELCNALLALSHEKAIDETTVVTKEIGSDCMAFFKHFIAIGYRYMQQTKEIGVDDYQDYVYMLVSSFADLYEAMHLQVQIDCAELFLHHGNERRAEEEYQYLFREYGNDETLVTRYQSAHS